MGLGGKGGRSSGRSYGGGSGANIGAVAGASRLFRSGSASLSSSSSSRSIDYSKWDEDEKKWLYKYSKDSRCRMATSLLDVCEDVWSPGHSRCNRYREVLADCPGKERASASAAQTRNA